MPDEWMLSTGLATVRMPDLFQILATVDAVPSQIMIDVLNLLDQEGAELPTVDPAQKFLRKRNKIRGMYSLASLILVSPRLILDRAPGDGEIGPDQLSWGDLEGLFYGYFWQGRRLAPQLSPARSEPDGAPEPAPPGGDVPPESGDGDGD